MSDAHKIMVSQPELKQILMALNGGSHLIRELQATRDKPPIMTGNPIDKLIGQYNAAVQGPDVLEVLGSSLTLIERYLDGAETCDHDSMDFIACCCVELELVKQIKILLGIKEQEGEVCSVEENQTS